MTNNDIHNFREIADTMTSNGNYKVVVEKTIGGKTYSEIKAFGLTKERAEDWARFYKGGKAEQM